MPSQPHRSRSSRSTLRRLFGWSALLASTSPAVAWAQTEPDGKTAPAALVAPLAAAGTETPRETPSATDARNRALAAIFVDQASQQARSTRRWRGAGTVGLGVLSGSAGAALLSREVETSAVILAVQGGVSLLSGVYTLTWARDPYERLSRHMATVTAAGASDAEILASTRLEWERLSAQERTSRRRSGIVSTSFGSALVITAAVLASVHHRDLDMTFREQILTVRVITGAGGALVAAGVYSFFAPSAIETGWSAWGNATRTSTLQSLRVGAAPMVGGGVLSLSGEL